jgi:serine/threonine protein kinase
MAACKQPILPGPGDIVGSGILRIVRIIGRGAFGTVYIAEDVEDGTFYAVKCLHPSHTARRGAPLNIKQIFEHEARHHATAFGSGHPNVIALLGTFAERGLYFLVFELCEGGDLLSNITTKPLFWGQDDLIKSAFLQIIDGVAHCHANGISHRDLKPENVLFDKNGFRFCVSDFGLATRNPLSSNTGTGSKHYKSPGVLSKVLTR